MAEEQLNRRLPRGANSEILELRRQHGLDVLRIAGEDRFAAQLRHAEGVDRTAGAGAHAFVAALEQPWQLILFQSVEDLAEGVDAQEVARIERGGLAAPCAGVAGVVDAGVDEMQRCHEDDGCQDQEVVHFGEVWWC